MPDITWDETIPRDSDYYSGYPTAHRSLMSSVAQAVANSINWPGSGGSLVTQAGVMRLGTFRADYALESSFSLPSTNTSGRVVVTSDTSRAFTPGSAATIFCGSMRAVENDSYPGTSARWVSVSTSTSASFLTVPYALTFNGLPVVQFSVQTDVQAQADTASALSLYAVTVFQSLTTQVAYRFVSGSGATDGVTVHMISTGTVTF